MVDYGIAISWASTASACVLVLLTTFLSFVSVIACWGIFRTGQGIHDLYPLPGDRNDRVFVALDLFLFYVFWK